VSTSTAVTVSNGLPLFNTLTAADVGLTDALPEYNAAAADNRTVGVDRLGGFVHPAVCDFRLTLESGVPFSTADQSAKSTIYLAPVQSQSGISATGNGRVCLFDGTRWKLYTSAQVSLAVGTVTTHGGYDLWLYDNAGTLTLEQLAWGSSTARSTALALQDGVLVKSGDATRRYVGSYTPNTTTTTDDADGARLLWSYYHRTAKRLYYKTGTTSWNYTNTTYRQQNADANALVLVFRGLDDELMDLEVSVNIFNSTTAVNANAGIGVDRTNGNDAKSYGGACPAAGFGTARGRYVGRPGLGYHVLNWVENSDAAGTLTWYGNNTGGLAKETGLLGWAKC
jgi:hypothetical protein